MVEGNPMMLNAGFVFFLLWLMSSYGEETLWYPVIPLCPDSFRRQEQKLLLWNDTVMFFWIQTIENGFIHDGCIRVNGFGRVGVGGGWGDCWMTSGCLMTLQEKSHYKTPRLNDILLSLETVHSNVCVCVCEDSWWRERDAHLLTPLKMPKLHPPPTPSLICKCTALQGAGQQTHTELPGSRKFAVVRRALGFLGISRLPSAMLTMAVMWVSGPKTWMGIPSVFPANHTVCHQANASNSNNNKKKEKKKAAYRKPVSIKWTMFSTTAGLFYYKTAKAYHTYFLK